MPTWILTHGDTDGICSGAIVFAAFRDARVFFSHPRDLAEDLRQVDGDIIICDIALPAAGMDGVLTELFRIRDGGNKILYIDHHPLPEKFKKDDFPAECLHSTNACASELAFMKFQDRLPIDLNRVAIYGAIGDTLDKTYNIEKFIQRWDKGHLYLESGLLAQAVDLIGRNYDVKREIVKLLADNRIPSSDERIVNKAISESINDETNRGRIKSVAKVYGKLAYALDMDWSLGKSAFYSMVENNTLVGIGGETRNGFVEMSLRTYAEGVDLNKLLIDVAEKLGGSGGGHPKAAGARVPADKFELFLQMLDGSISKDIGNFTAEY